MHSKNRKYLLLGWYEGSTIEDSKIFGLFSSIEEARKIQDSYINTNVKGFSLNWMDIDTEFLPTLDGHTVYTEVIGEYGRKWREATQEDKLST